MHRDDYTKISHKRYSSLNNNNDKKIKYLKNLITRILLSIIVVISIAIVIKINPSNVKVIDKYLFQDNLKFTKISKWYQDKFGKIIPDTGDNSELVFNNDMSKNNYKPYKDGVEIEISKGSPISSLYGGIIIFIGEKEGYGNTVIIQGNDGIDYTYGNITNINVNLYDYIEKDTIIGETNDNYLYLILEKDGQYIDYDEYRQKNQN